MLATLATRHLYFSKVLAARKKNLTTNRARKNKHTARKDHSIPLMLCIPVLDGRKETRDETLRTTAWEARFARTVSVCVYWTTNFKTLKSFIAIIRNSDICLTINYFLSWPKDDKI